MRRWLIRQVRDSVGDSLFAGAALILSLVLLGIILWYDYDILWVLNFNLSAVHLVTSLIPYIGRRLETILRLRGIDFALFELELWAFVALIMRAVGLGFRGLVWLVRRPFKRRTRN